MQNKLVIRCQDKTHGEKHGNILCAVSENNIFIKCQDRDCHRWTKITFSIPGIKLDLRTAGIVQESMPEDYHLHLEPATTVVTSK
jgi:hypothetical protein